jgi:predicted permease
MLRDIRYGVRMLRKHPGFTAVAVLSLAIGIGANTAIFSLVNAIILREVPYQRPEELVDINFSMPNFSFPVLSYPNFEDLRDGTAGIFSGVVATQLTPAEIGSGVGVGDDVLGAVVTGGYFSVLGIDAMLGRAIGPDDDRTPGAHPVVMLSHSYWQSAFDGDPDLVGRELRLNDRFFTVIGVAPADYPGSFRGIVQPAFYAPMMMLDELTGGNLLDARESHNVFAKARLASGATLAQAEAAVAAVVATLTAARPEGWEPASTFTLVPTTDVLLYPAVDGGIRVSAWLLMVAVASVLLLACVNLAGFLLARALDRRREVAVRLALGASRGALVRQLLTETTLLGLLGGGVGLGLAVWLLRVVRAVDLGLPVRLMLDVAPDSTVLAFTVGISTIAGTVLGLVPALQSTRPDVASTLKSETAEGGQPGQIRWRNAMVVTQLTVSLVLLVGAGLFLRSLQQRQAMDPGFGQTPTAIMSVAVPATRFAADEGRQYTSRLLDRFRSLPGVDAVGLIDRLPLTVYEQWIDFTVDGHEPLRDQDAFQADRAIVGTGFFDAAGIPLVQGRRFADSDRQGSQRVVIVSAAMARRFWPNGEAVGQRVHLTGGSPALPGGNVDLRVVGVARDINWRSLGEEPRLLVYVPYSQYLSQGVTFLARTSADAEQTALALLSTGTDMDAELSVQETLTMRQHLSAGLRPTQVVAFLMSVFAMLTLMLATIGLYGVVSYAIATRTREVGIRMALGAEASAIRRLLTTSGARLVVVGITMGLVLSLLVTRLISSLLFGIETFDPITFVSAPLVLGAAGLLAAYLPAHRASRIDPLAALRTD